MFGQEALNPVTLEAAVAGYISPTYLRAGNPRLRQPQGFRALRPRPRTRRPTIKEKQQAVMFIEKDITPHRQ
jgi:hypothetical protein